MAKKGYTTYYDSIDIMFCVKCEQNTEHGYKSSGHERCSAGDVYKCLVCDNFQDPFNLEYERE